MREESQVADSISPVTPGSVNSVNSEPYSQSGSAGGSLSSQTEISSTNEGEYNSDASDEPRRFRLLSNIYNETDEVELEEELLLAGVDEPSTYKEAVVEQGWKAAMNAEIESIEKNGTW